MVRRRQKVNIKKILELYGEKATLAARDLAPEIEMINHVKDVIRVAIKQFCWWEGSMSSDIV